MNIVLTPSHLATWHRKSFSGQKKNKSTPTCKNISERHDLSHQNLWRMFQYLKCEVYAWRSSWQPDSDHAACVSRLCDTWNRCSAWYGTSLIQRCQICETSDLRRGKMPSHHSFQQIQNLPAKWSWVITGTTWNNRHLITSTVKCNRQYRQDCTVSCFPQTIC